MFCPAKVFRDDHDFCERMQIYFAAWKLGQVPSGERIDTMFTEDLELLTILIMGWEHYDKVDKFKTLGTLLGGKQ